jgi:hypothetical protein
MGCCRAGTFSELRAAAGIQDNARLPARKLRRLIGHERQTEEQPGDVFRVMGANLHFRY